MTTKKTRNMTANEELLEEANRIKNQAIDAFRSKAFKKYDAGQEEHGGLLTERVSLEDLEDEIIDLWFYLQALKERLAKAGDEGCCHANQEEA